MALMMVVIDRIFLGE